MRHKKNIWNYFVLCLAVVFASLMPTTAYGAADWPSEVAIEADGGILMDAENDPLWEEYQRGVLSGQHHEASDGPGSAGPL